MTLNDIITDLQYGELSKHGMFVGEISEQDKANLITHINIGLLDLYTRFPLLTKELALIQSGYITQYYLNSAHAESNTASTEVKYIRDTARDPFQDDIISIMNVYDEVGDCYTINGCGCKSVFTPAIDVIEIPYPVDTNALFVIYRAKHPTVSLTDTQLYLPIHFKAALLAYVAHRVYSGGTAQEHMLMANSMLQKYELLCTQQRLYGTTNQNENDPMTNFETNGWI